MRTRFGLEPPPSVAVLKRLLQRGGIDARSVQKTPAGVLVVRRGLFFVKRQRRYAAYLQKSQNFMSIIMGKKNTPPKQYCIFPMPL